ncbi:MAG: molybdopterin-dependent oxidoreductase [Firmicutes bacterium]|nr:molybdopterin-dependent oxidoreductase [Bacillota bacterium]
MTERRTVLTTCTRDCPDTCGIKAFVTNDRLVGLTGINEHEITRSFLCRKALSYIQRVYSPDRVLMPLCKIDGEWQQLRWDAALRLIADRIEKVIEQYGSTAILHYQGSGSLGALKMLNKRFFNLLGGVTEASGSLCGGAGSAGQTMDFGIRASHDPLDLFNSELIILWGRNPSDTNLHLMPILKEARANGARIVLIDPVNTDTGRYSDMHIRPKPGMDGYLALGMAKVILESAKDDAYFIISHTENFEAYRQMIDGFSMEFLSKRSGVSAVDIEILANLYVERKPAAIVLGWGLQRYQWGAEVFRLIDALAAITGNIGIPGGGVSHGKDNYGYFDESVKGKEFAVKTRQIPKPLLGKAIKEMADPPIKMAFINGANPINQSPDTAAVVEAFKGIDFVVVFEQFLTDTAEIADLVLPVTTFLEETDVVASYWHNYVGAVNQVIEPVGMAKTDLEIYQELAELLGFGEQMAGSADYWIKRIIKPLESRGITLDTLRKAHKRVPDAPMVPFKDKVFETASGKFNFITSFSTPTLDSDEFPLILLTTHSRQWIHSQILPPEHNLPLKAKVHPATAMAYGLPNGADARIVSQTGEAVVVVEHDESIREDAIKVVQGRWGRFGQSINHLVPALMSYDGQNASYYQTMVRLEKI